MESRLSIFIPSFNAEKTLRAVIDRIPSSLRPRINAVYMIDDGSRDRTGDVIRRICGEYPYCVHVSHEVNRGYGETVKHGLMLCRNDGCTFAVCLHADGQYPPEVIAAGMDRMHRENADLLQGSRIASGTALSGGMPLYKYIAGRALTLLENSVFRMNLTDYHSGFLVYRDTLLQRLDLPALSASFDFDLEVIASARAAGMRIIEMPVQTRYADEVSYLNPVTYGLRVLRVLLKYICGRYKKRT